MAKQLALPGLERRAPTSAEIRAMVRHKLYAFELRHAARLAQRKAIASRKRAEQRLA